MKKYPAWFCQISTRQDTRDVEEVIYLIKGTGNVVTEKGETYILDSCDSILIPARISHKHVNSSNKQLEQMWIFTPQESKNGLRNLPIIKESYNV